MTPKRLLLTALLATTGLGLAARSSDILTNLRLTTREANDFVFQAVTADFLAVPQVSTDARRWAAQLSKPARIEAVQALGQVVQAYTETADFRRRYDEWQQRHYGVSLTQTQEANQAARAQLSDEQATYQQLVVQSTTSFAQMDPAMLRLVLQSQLESKTEEISTAEGVEKAGLAAELAQLWQLQPLSHTNPVAFKKQFVAYLTQVLNQKATDELKKREQNMTANQQQAADYQKRLAQYQAHADPNSVLKQKLRVFIALTESVDFDAKVVPENHRIEFVNPAYRSKPNDWKLLYRLGREPVMAARAFAQAWLQKLP